MNFKQTIDALVKLYARGMKSKRYTELIRLRLDEGICATSDIHDLSSLCNSRTFKKYKPKDVISLYWFTPPYVMKYDGVPFSKIKEQAIKPRLELLKRIQKDLKKRESKPKS